jgi:hypothetical protein
MSIGFFKKKKKKKGGEAAAPQAQVVPAPGPLGPLSAVVGGVPVWAALLGGGLLVFFIMTQMKGRRR